MIIFGPLLYGILRMFLVILYPIKCKLLCSIPSAAIFSHKFRLLGKIPSTIKSDYYIEKVFCT